MLGLKEALRIPLDAGRWRADWWQLGILLTAMLFSIPTITIISFLLQPASDVWQHLVSTVLGKYISNSALLMLGVAIGTLLIGVSSAWLTSLCQFPGKRIFTWALLLPMAMPAYIIAYTYTGMFDFAGPIQSQIREWTGWQHGDYYFPEIRSLGGAVILLSLVLYPYVYLLARAAFLEQSVCVIEVSRTLGCNPWQSFYRVALPLARPAIIAGLSLALMETLADYGTVSYFGLGVFTTGIFRTWFSLGDSAAAAKLAVFLLFFVASLVILERWSRRQAGYQHTSNRHRELPQYQLSGRSAWLAVCACAAPIFLGFILPAAQLSVWAIKTYSTMVDATFITITLNSFGLAISTAILAVMLALLLSYAKRIARNRLVSGSVAVVAAGYALPGTIIAVGVMIPFAWLDNTLDGFMRTHFQLSTGLILSGSVFTLIFAYMVRFSSVSIQSIESGLAKIKPSLDDASRSLGHNSRVTLQKVHLPLMRGSALTALLIVFVDVMKELPATLILRPFNFNTLSVRAFELASDERLADSSTAALMIVVVGLIPVILLSKSISISRVGS